MSRVIAWGVVLLICGGIYTYGGGLFANPFKALPGGTASVADSLPKPPPGCGSGKVDC